MKLLLIRHAQSANNLLYQQTGSSQGRHHDPPLSELGCMQAEKLAQHAPTDETLSRLTHLYASLTTRAVQTAAPLAGVLNLPVQGLADAHECGGLYERLEDGSREPRPGRTHTALLAECAALQWPADLNAGTCWDGGFEAEEDAAYTNRAARVIRALRDQHSPDDRVALVMHNYFAQFLLAELGGWTGWSGTGSAWFSMNNTSTTLIELGPDYNVIRWVNRHDHLSADLVSF